MASISVHRHHVLEIEIEGKPQITKVVAESTDERKRMFGIRDVPHALAMA
jgi:hypothetical protein